MNTRLQVEHPISEMVSGIDIVREQLRIAAGMPLSWLSPTLCSKGHAIECRINAENAASFQPSPGEITTYLAPGGLGVRVDSALYQGYIVPPHYDSLVAKLILHGTSRNECIMRMRRALEEFVIAGIDTTIPLHQQLAVEPDFIDGNYDVHWLERFVARARTVTTQLDSRSLVARLRRRNFSHGRFCRDHRDFLGRPRRAWHPARLTAFMCHAALGARSATETFEMRCDR